MNSVVYRGPVKLPVRKEDVIAVNLSTSGVIATTSVATVATYNTVFAAADITGYTDWADYKSLYQEFRVLGLRFKFYPKFAQSELGAMANAAGTAGVGFGQTVQPLVVARAHGELTALTSFENAINHQNNTITSINRTVECSIKMNEVDEAVWNSTQSGTAAVMGVKTYFAAATIGATDVVYWGTYVVTQAVQFRGRVIAPTQITRALLDRSRVASEKDAKLDLKTSSPVPLPSPIKLDWYEVSMEEERLELQLSAIRKKKQDNLSLTSLVKTGAGKGAEKEPLPDKVKA